MTVQPYLFFDGRCEEALDYYRRALGAEIEMMMRFKESPDPAMCAGVQPEKIMHASFKLAGASIMGSDGRCEGKTEFKGFALSLSVPDEATADRIFGALADNGQVQMPMSPTFFAKRFGMVMDRFGVTWMIILPQA